MKGIMKDMNSSLKERNVNYINKTFFLQYIGQKLRNAIAAVNTTCAEILVQTKYNSVEVIKRRSITFQSI